MEIGPALQVPAIVRGTVAAAMASEPDLSGAAGEVRRLPNAYDAVANQFYLKGWFARRDRLAKNGDPATKLVKVANQTATWSNGHHSETAPIFAKYTRIDVERIKSMMRAVYGRSA